MGVFYHLIKLRFLQLSPFDFLCSFFSFLKGDHPKSKIENGSEVVISKSQFSTRETEALIYLKSKTFQHRTKNLFTFAILLLITNLFANKKILVRYLKHDFECSYRSYHRKYTLASIYITSQGSTHVKIVKLSTTILPIFCAF